MTTAPLSTPPATPQTTRVSIRPQSTDGFIDAAWWPHTASLSDELPGLLEAFWALGRQINRVSYAVGSWDVVPRRLDIDGRTVRLGAFATSDAHTIRLSDAWRRERIDVLVVAPETDTRVAERILLIAGRAGNERAERILALANGTDDLEPTR